MIWRVKLTQNTGTRIQERKQAEKRHTVGALPWRILPPPSGFDSTTCDSQQRNDARGCMGPEEHQDSSWDKYKKKPPKDPTHTHAPPLPSPPSSLHCIIPLALSQGLFFVVVLSATSMAFGRLCCRPRASLPFFPSCIDLVITQMQIFLSDPLRSADETPITLL